MLVAAEVYLPLPLAKGVKFSSKQAKGRTKILGTHDSDVDSTCLPAYARGRRFFDVVSLVMQVC